MVGVSTPTSTNFIYLCCCAGLCYFLFYTSVSTCFNFNLPCFMLLFFYLIIIIIIKIIIDNNFGWGSSGVKKTTREYGS